MNFIFNSRNGGLKFFSVSFFALLLGGILFSCNKPEFIDPNAVLSKSELLNARYDSVQKIKSYSVLLDSVASDETSLNLAGCIKDADFGTTYAGFYAQLRLTNPDQNFGNNPSCDSAVLSLAYYNFYGDTNTTHTFHVKRIEEGFSNDNTYFSNKTFNLSDDLGFARKTTRFTDSVIVSGNKTAPHLRIRLSNVFWQDFINSPITKFSNDDIFTDYFKGIYVYTDEIFEPNKGSIISFDLLNPQSKLTVYYNGISYDFVFTGKSARANNFKHNYTGTEIAKQVGATATDTNQVYLQGGAGAGIRLLFPELKKLTDSGKVVINKAELVLNVPATSTANYAAPPKILLSRYDVTGIDQILPDQFIGSTYFGGTYDSKLMQYKFNIAKYVQEVIDEKYTDNGLRLLPSGSAISPSRVIIGGQNHPTAPMKLNITYTKY